MRYETIGMRQRQDAVIFAGFVNQQIENQITVIKSYLRSQWWKDAILEGNRRYVDWNPKAISEYMARMDEQWAKAAPESPLVQEYLTSRMGKRLKMLNEEDPVIAEVFLTDKFGGVVASSGKTSDFYQADENWWQSAYHEGEGSIFVGDIALDESSGKISLVVAAPLVDPAGQVIGVAKFVLNVFEFFKPLNRYKIGQTGHVALLDARGLVIQHPGLDPMSNKACVSSAELNRLLENPKHYAIVKAEDSGEKFLIAVAPLKNPLLEENNIHWVLVVTQKAYETFLPLYQLMARGIFLVIAIAILIMVVMRKIIQYLFIAPLEKIREGVRRFTGGDLNHRIEIKTADEFESLAGVLNEMTAMITDLTKKLMADH